jgi:hypothetical protein
MKRKLMINIFMLVVSIVIFITGCGNKSNKVPEEWGLGTNVEESVSNNRNYEWYVDQGDTGLYSYGNCGPSSVTMILKWKDKNFNKTAEEARNEYRPEGGYWYPEDIIMYLDDNNVSCDLVEGISTEKIKEEVKLGKIILLATDTSYLTYNKAIDESVGKFYSNDFKHFVIVKGYKIVDNKTYFEVYDPFSIHEQYTDGTRKGKDRYYFAKELVSAAVNYWDNMYVVK